MSANSGLLIVLLLTSIVVGITIALIKTGVINLSNSKQINLFYSALIITLLLFFVGLSAQLLTSDTGKRWLNSFSNSGDCDKPDRPYWCEL